MDSEGDAPSTFCDETPQPLSWTGCCGRPQPLSGEGCGIWDSGFIGGWGLGVVAAIAAGVAGGAGGFAGADVLGRGEVPGFALGAEVRAEERGVRAVALDAVAGLAGVGLATVTGFPAGSGEAGRCDGCGFLQVGGGFVGIERIRVEAEFAEQFVDAFVGFRFHLGRWREQGAAIFRFAVVHVGRMG